MTQEEILQYNKMCVEFLNLHRDEEVVIYNMHSYCYDLLKFDSDWNWIMEVVEAIEKIFHIQGVEIEGRWCCIKTNIFHECRGLTKKEAVVYAINQFLIWYNKNKINELRTN